MCKLNCRSWAASDELASTGAANAENRGQWNTRHTLSFFEQVSLQRPILFYGPRPKMDSLFRKREQAFSAMNDSARSTISKGGAKQA